MLAECRCAVLECDGLRYLNLVRKRAGMPAMQAITADELLKNASASFTSKDTAAATLSRFGKYTGSSYNWSWKNGEYTGASLPEYRALFPIPMQYTGTIRTESRLLIHIIPFKTHEIS